MVKKGLDTFRKMEISKRGRGGREQHSNNPGSISKSRRYTKLDDLISSISTLSIYIALLLKFRGFVLC